MTDTILLHYVQFETAVAALLLERTDKVQKITWIDAELDDATKSRGVFQVAFHHRQPLDEQLSYFSQRRFYFSENVGRQIEHALKEHNTVRFGEGSVLIEWAGTEEEFLSLFRAS